MQLDETRGSIAAAGRSENAGGGSNSTLNRTQRTVLVARRELVRRVLEVGGVEEVEELRSELQLHDFRGRDRNDLESTEVHIGVRRPDEAVTALLAEVGRWSERANKVALAGHGAIRKEGMRTAAAMAIKVIVELLREQDNCTVGESRGAGTSDAAEALG